MMRPIRNALFLSHATRIHCLASVQIASNCDRITRSQFGKSFFGLFLFAIKKRFDESGNIFRSKRSH